MHDICKLQLVVNHKSIVNDASCFAIGVKASPIGATWSICWANRCLINIPHIIFKRAFTILPLCFASFMQLGFRANFDLLVLIGGGLCYERPLFGGHDACKALQ